MDPPPGMGCSAVHASKSSTGLCGGQHRPRVRGRPGAPGGQSPARRRSGVRDRLQLQLVAAHVASVRVDGAAQRLVETSGCQYADEAIRVVRHAGPARGPGRGRGPCRAGRLRAGAAGERQGPAGRRLTTKDLTEVNCGLNCGLNSKMDAERQKPKDVAEEYLKSKDLL